MFSSWKFQIYDYTESAAAKHGKCQTSLAILSINIDSNFLKSLLYQHQYQKTPWYADCFGAEAFSAERHGDSRTTITVWPGNASLLVDGFADGCSIAVPGTGAG
jgi:hypothetical protein